MISESYIPRPATVLVVQLTEADETEIKTALAAPSLTITRDPEGHWTFQATMSSYEADDGDWVARLAYGVGPANGVRGQSGWQQVTSTSVDYVVS